MYNSIYGDCDSGQDKQDGVTCALNGVDFSFPGDECPAGYFAAGNLQRIDTEFRRVVGASLNAAAAASAAPGRNLVLEYDGFVNAHGVTNNYLYNGEYLLVSSTVRDADTDEVVASSTGMETFKVRFILLSTSLQTII
jgi:hypothetical protein